MKHTMNIAMVFALGVVAGFVVAKIMEKKTNKINSIEGERIANDLLQDIDVLIRSSLNEKKSV